MDGRAGGGGVSATAVLGRRKERGRRASELCGVHVCLGGGGFVCSRGAWYTRVISPTRGGGGVRHCMTWLDLQLRSWHMLLLVRRKGWAFGVRGRRGHEIRRGPTGVTTIGLIFLLTW